MKKIAIESPYAGDVERNVRYAKAFFDLSYSGCGFEREERLLYHCFLGGHFRAMTEIPLRFT